MNCDEFLSLIDSMIDGELSVESTARVSAHADSCTRCGPERDRLIQLHEQMSELNSQIEMSDSLESRIKSALEAESKLESKPKSTNKLFLWKSPQMAVAAVLLSLIVAGIYITQQQHPTVNIAENQTQSCSRIAVDDLVNHTKEHIISKYHYSVAQLPELEKQTGFSIQPPKLRNWKLADICVCSIGEHGEPVVHITYVNSTTTGPKTLTCYQVLSDNFDYRKTLKQKPSAANTWSSEFDNLAVAFAPGHKVASVFIAKMPVKELRKIATQA